MQLIQCRFAFKGEMRNSTVLRSDDEKNSAVIDSDLVQGDR
jgi:hypothetical protein